MGTALTTKSDEDHIDALEDMIDAGEADSISEALRQTSQAELARRGYLNGTHRASPVQRLSREFAKAFAWIGVAWLAITFVFPVQFRLGAVFAFAAALGCIALERGLEWRASGDMAVIGRGEKA